MNKSIEVTVELDTLLMALIASNARLDTGLDIDEFYDLVMAFVVMTGNQHMLNLVHERLVSLIVKFELVLNTYQKQGETISLNELAGLLGLTQWSE